MERNELRRALENLRVGMELTSLEAAHQRAHELGLRRPV